MAQTAQKINDTKEPNTNYCRELNSKAYIFLSWKILSNSLLSFINLIILFHQDYLILKEIWL